MTVHGLENEVGKTIGSYYEILSENLQMSKIAAKFAPRLLILEQKEDRLTILR